MYFIAQFEIPKAGEEPEVIDSKLRGENDAAGGRWRNRTKGSRNLYITSSTSKHTGKKKAGPGARQVRHISSQVRRSMKSARVVWERWKNKTHEKTSAKNRQLGLFGLDSGAVGLYGLTPEQEVCCLTGICRSISLGVA
jgi:hypothetical protein